MSRGSEYFNVKTHRYMKNSDELFPEYVLKQIEKNIRLKTELAIEIGAGMGRFSKAIEKRFARLIIVEPVDEYYRILQQLFDNENVRIEKVCVEEFFPGNIENNTIIFAFHLMHHLKYEQRALIYKYIMKTRSMGIFIEPNRTNPLFFFQILFSAGMRLKEEKRYLRLSTETYKKEQSANGLSTRLIKRFCFFPPPLIRILLLFRMRTLLNFSEKYFNHFFPFLSSYQLIVCSRDHEE